MAGTVELCGGEVVYRDYVYDDFGAGPPVPVDLPLYQWSSYPTFDAYGGLPPSGVERYADGQANTADLVALRLSLDGGTVQVSAELNTLFDAGSTILALAIDTDDDRSTGGGAWDGVTGVASDGWDEIHTFATGDPVTNLVSGTFPAPPGPRWRVQALTAKADGTPMNVAFRGIDETGFWWEDLQAAALQDGDISAFGFTVDTADLTGGVTRRADVPAGAIRQRVYVSENPLGEGLDMAGVPGPGYADGAASYISQAFNFLGKYQPYGFYLPDQAGPHGVQLLLHGLAENHSARLVFPGAQGNITRQIGEDRNRILVSPLGRGWKNWWSSYGERDALDALADVEATYDVDTEREFAGGYSMGGYGALRLASLHPDRFAGLINWVGFTGDEMNGTPFAGQGGGTGGGALGNTLDLVGNLRHVPGASLYSGADELVPVTQAVALRDALAQREVPSIFYLHPAADHLTYAEIDDWAKESAYTADLSLVRDPVHVTFRTDRRFFLPELGIVPDAAYWLSAIVPAGEGYADVDGFSGCAGTDPVTTVEPGAGPSPVPWESNEVVVAPGTPRAAANRIELTLANVSSLTVDVDGACIDEGEVAYHVVTDGPATVALSDGRTITVDEAGTHDGSLAAAGASGTTATTTPTSAPAAGTPRGELPATGGRSSWPLVVGGALLLLGFAVKPRHP